MDHSEAGLYLWSTRDGENAWDTVSWLADRGILAAPGTFYGPTGDRHVRIALTATDLAAALSASAAFRRRAQQWWADGWDLLVTPTLGEVPLPLGTMANDPAHPIAPLARAGAFVPFTPAFNMSGQPAISLPLHWNADGLPIGVQLVAAYGREDVLVRLASQLEQAHPWADRHP